METHLPGRGRLCRAGLRPCSRRGLDGCRAHEVRRGLRKVVLVRPQSAGQSRKSALDVGVELRLKDRNQYVPEAVAGVVEREIGFIRAERQPPRLEICHHLGARGLEKRPGDVPCEGRHASQAGKARAPDHGEQDGLCLVVSRVPDGNAAIRAGCRSPPKKSVPGLASGRFR